MTRALLIAVVAVLLGPATAALADPPPNDAPGAAEEFQAVTAANGTPDERQAIAELRDATADAGVPRCLGRESFARTVWFRVPAADAAREVQIEASGRTTDVVDLAVFVQPVGGTNTGEPNACAGAGAGGAEASEEPSSGVVLRVPGGRSLLVQAGRRGTPASSEDERAVLSLAVRDLPAVPPAPGDRADASTPAIGMGTAQVVARRSDDDRGGPGAAAVPVARRRLAAPRAGRGRTAEGDRRRRRGRGDHRLRRRAADGRQRRRMREPRPHGR